jgi:LL-diaminopimelate aminotransferase
MLREKIASKLYNNLIAPDEVFVSDGAKCDISRLQMMFGSEVVSAVQDPSYPVYVDTAVMMGQTGNYNQEQGNFDKIVYMECKPETGFFPDLSKLPRTDLIYFCSPNNPTGAVATRAQLESLVKFAKQNKSIIIYDAAYSLYIQDSDLPKSIFEIPGSKEVALEVNSFSKMSGFTGVRLGWTVIPNELKFDDGSSVKSDWIRLVNTIFNGASNIAQAGGLAALDPKGFEEMQDLVKFYMENARIIREALQSKGVSCYGGDNAPYIWAHFPEQDSWAVFEKFLKKAHVVTTPGSGFGQAGSGFLRFSAFGHRENILEAVERIKQLL